MGPVSRRPATLVPRTPARGSTSSRSTFLAQLAASRGGALPVACGTGVAAASRALSPICSVDRTPSGPAVSVMASPPLLLLGDAVERRFLVVVDRDGFVQPGELEDLPVVRAQPVGGELLALPVGSHQQGDQHADAATVHVLKA